MGVKIPITGNEMGEGRKGVVSLKVSNFVQILNELFKSTMDIKNRY